MDEKQQHYKLQPVKTKHFKTKIKQMQGKPSRWRGVRSTDVPLLSSVGSNPVPTTERKPIFVLLIERGDRPAASDACCC